MEEEGVSDAISVVKIMWKRFQLSEEIAKISFILGDLKDAGN